MNPTEKSHLLARLRAAENGVPLKPRDVAELIDAVESIPTGPTPLPVDVSESMNTAAERALAQKTADSMLLLMHRATVGIKHAHKLRDGVLSKSEPYLRVLTELRRRILFGDPLGAQQVQTQRWPAELHRTLQLAAYTRSQSLNQFVSLAAIETLTESAWRPATWIQTGPQLCKPT